MQARSTTPFGHAVRALRLLHNLTQAQLATLASVHHRSIDDIERGLRYGHSDTLHKSDVASRVAFVFGLLPGELLFLTQTVGVCQAHGCDEKPLFFRRCPRHGGLG